MKLNRAHLLLGTLVVLALVGPAQGQDFDPLWQRAMNNAAHEQVECAAYFSIVAIGLENSNDQATADRYWAASSTALETALLLGEEAGLLPETHGARFDIAVLTMKDRIGGNTSNISILFRDYAELCRVASESLDSRLTYWLSREGLAN